MQVRSYSTRKLRWPIVVSLLTRMLSDIVHALLLFQHTSNFNIPFLLHKHWLTLKLSAAVALPPFYDTEINKLVISLEEGHSETDRIRVWGGPGGLLREIMLSQSSPECSAAEVKIPKRHRKGDPKLQRLSGSLFDTGRHEILCQDRASSAF